MKGNPAATTTTTPATPTATTSAPIIGDMSAMGLVLQARKQAALERDTKARQLQHMTELKGKLDVPRRMMLILANVQADVEARLDADLASARAYETSLASAVLQAQRLQAALRQAEAQPAHNSSSPMIAGLLSSGSLGIPTSLQQQQHLQQQQQQQVAEGTQSGRRPCDEESGDLVAAMQARLSTTRAARHSAEKRLLRFCSSSRRMLEALSVLDFMACGQWLREKETSIREDMGRLDQLMSTLT